MNILQVQSPAPQSILVKELIALGYESHIVKLKETDDILLVNVSDADFERLEMSREIELIVLPVDLPL